MFKTLLYLSTRLIQVAVLAEIALLLVDLDVYKPKLARAASDALGMEVRIDGPVRLSVLAGPRVALRDVRVRNRGRELAAVSVVRLGLDLTPLRDRRSPRGDISLSGARVLLERDHRGFNFDVPRDPGERLPAFELAHFAVADLKLHYVDRQAGSRIEAAGCDLESEHLEVVRGPADGLWRALSLSARLTCREIRTRQLTLAGTRATVHGRGGVFDFDPIEARVLGGRGRGAVRADFSGHTPAVRIRYALSHVRVEELFDALPAKRRPRGAIDVSGAVSFHGSTRAQIVRTARGEMSLRGNDLVFEGVDLDDAIEGFESSQGLGLLDFGALVYAGPLGLLVSRGVNLASAVPESGGHTRIATIVSDWTIAGGAAHAEDVALATERHRIALRGKLDLINERFDDVVIAVVGPDGCARLPHAVSGPFRQPALDRPGALASFAGPLLRFFKAVGRCEVFYAGSVAVPE